MPRLNMQDRAFTLVELLVALAVIAVVASLAFPGFQQAMIRAKRTKCASNLRQLYQGVILFTGDNDGTVPYGVKSKVLADAQWNRRIYPYLVSDSTVAWPGSIGGLYLCPADKAPYVGRLSYGFNDTVADIKVSAMRQVPVMLADASYYALFNFGKTAAVKYNHAGLAQAILWDGSMMSSNAYPALSAAPVLWQPN